MFDQHNAPIADVPVYVFDNETYTNISATTDANGEVSFTLPEGAYRFHADVGGTQLFSSESNECVTSSCDGVTIIANHVTVTVATTGGALLTGLPVYVFEGEPIPATKTYPTKTAN